MRLSAARRFAGRAQPLTRGVVRSRTGAAARFTHCLGASELAVMPGEAD